LLLSDLQNSQSNDILTFFTLWFNNLFNFGLHSFGKKVNHLLIMQHLTIQKHFFGAENCTRIDELTANHDE